jgi:hypothetical protein
VDSNSVPDYSYFSSYSRLHDVPFRSERSAAQAAPSLTARAALLVILLLSLGLWAAIWVAGCALASFLAPSIAG